MKFFRVLLPLGMLVFVAAAATAPPPTLPAFAGWQKVQSQVASRAGWGLSRPEAAAMAEFGLAAIERDIYARGSRRIVIEGMRFGDATGAYGAFTYYRPANFHPFDLAQPKEQTASGDTHVLFTRGTWLIQVQMDELTAMTASDMRALAAALHPTPGTSLTLPTLPYYLPRPQLEANSIRYAEGPAAFAAACAWLPAQSAGFDQDAEAIVGTYDLPGADPGSVQMVVLSYPTPQMARTRLPQLSRLEGVEARRSGPMLVLVHGIGGAPAQNLLQAVNYDAEITMVPPTPVGIEALPALILGIFVLCGLIIGVAIVVGVLTGGVRVLVQRVLPERFHRTPPESLIRLHLE